MVYPIENLNAAGGERLAVIGLGVDFPGCQDLEGFVQAVALGTTLTAALENWKPAGSLARAATAAWQDAGWNGPRQPHEVGWLMVGPGAQISAARAITSLHGPEMDFGGYGEPLPGMLVQAHEWLESHQVDCVILAGNTQAAGPADAGTPQFGFDQGARPNPMGSGSVAIALMRLDQALLRKAHIYAVLEGLASSSRPAGKPSAALVMECAQAAMRQAGTAPGEIGYLEVTGAGEENLDLAEIEGLCQAYRAEAPRTALGSVQATTGNLSLVNGLAGLLRAAVCLENRIRPGVPGWSGPKRAELWQGSSFYVLTASLAWFYPEYPGKRKAAVNLATANGSAAHLILSGMESEDHSRPTLMREAGQTLLQVGGNSMAGLTAGLEAVRAEIQTEACLAQIARRQFETMQRQKPAYQAVILGRSKEDVTREIDFALRGIPAAFRKGRRVANPGGQLFHLAPVGARQPGGIRLPWRI